MTRVGALHKTVCVEAQTLLGIPLQNEPQEVSWAANCAMLCLSLWWLLSFVGRLTLDSWFFKQPLTAPQLCPGSPSAPPEPPQMILMLSPGEEGMAVSLVIHLLLIILIIYTMLFSPQCLPFLILKNLVWKSKKKKAKPNANHFFISIWKFPVTGRSIQTCRKVQRPQRWIYLDCRSGHRLAHSVLRGPHNSSQHLFH